MFIPCYYLFFRAHMTGQNLYHLATKSNHSDLKPNTLHYLRFKCSPGTRCNKFFFLSANTDQRSTPASVMLQPSADLQEKCLFLLQISPNFCNSHPSEPPSRPITDTCTTDSSEMETRWLYAARPLAQPLQEDAPQIVKWPLVLESLLSICAFGSVLVLVETLGTVF